ncbi:MAG: GntR family transcriptional regulator [Desulfohalobiaceae bacterium]|nr:GntR family transcriptional regulator [Desulfohalobiaceae bacterium]
MLDPKKYKFENLVLAEKITNILTKAVLEGEIKSGEQLVELEYQKLFNISRSPIREAFRKLEKMGMVEIIPRKGTFVKSLSQRDIEENFPVRATLEGLAAKMAYQNRDEYFLNDLEQKLLDMEAAAEKHDSMRFWKEHSVFHEFFIEKSENKILRDVLFNLRTQSLWFQFSYKYFQEDLKRAYRVHENILEMFKTEETQPVELENFVRQHIEWAKDKFLKYLQEI